MAKKTTTKKPIITKELIDLMNAFETYLPIAPYLGGGKKPVRDITVSKSGKFLTFYQHGETDKAFAFYMGGYEYARNLAILGEKFDRK